MARINFRKLVIPTSVGIGLVFCLTLGSNEIMSYYSEQNMENILERKKEDEKLFDDMSESIANIVIEDTYISDNVNIEDLRENLETLKNSHIDINSKKKLISKIEEIILRKEKQDKLNSLFKSNYIENGEINSNPSLREDVTLKELQSVQKYLLNISLAYMNTKKDFNSMMDKGINIAFSQYNSVNKVIYLFNKYISSDKLVKEVNRKDYEHLSKVLKDMPESSLKEEFNLLLKNMLTKISESERIEKEKDLLDKIKSDIEQFMKSFTSFEDIDIQLYDSIISNLNTLSESKDKEELSTLFDPITEGKEKFEKDIEEKEKLEKEEKDKLEKENRKKDKEHDNHNKLPSEPLYGIIENTEYDELKGNSQKLFDSFENANNWGEWFKSTYNSNYEVIEVIIDENIIGYTINI